MKSFHIPELDTPFVFGEQPESLPGDFRPMWRIASVLLILGLASRGKKSSFGRLHVLNWGLRTKENRSALKEMIDGNLAPDVILVRIEPSLNRAVDLASAEGLLQRISGDRVKLSDPGGKAVATIVDSGALDIERQYLEEIGVRLTEKQVKRVFSGSF